MLFNNYIWYSIQEIANLSYGQKLIIDLDDYQNERLQLDNRYFRDLKRNIKGFSRNQLIPFIKIIFLKACLLVELPKNNVLSSNHEREKLRLLQRGILGLYTMNDTYQQLPIIINLINEVENMIYNLMKQIHYDHINYYHLPQPSLFHFHQILFEIPNKIGYQFPVSKMKMTVSREKLYQLLQRDDT